ncbi:MAG: hypothetical protein IPI19_12090 [Ignavibacteriales bacterium]|nr:hypothetical protein [Ignavibacteriales bacterium]
MDTTSDNVYNKCIEKMFIRDALLRKKSRKNCCFRKMKCPVGLKRNSIKTYVRFLFSLYEIEEINNLHKLLQNGVPFDSILIESPGERIMRTNNSCGNSFGQMVESVEEILFNLKINDFTRTVLTP